jgi:hypothetical protein
LSQHRLTKPVAFQPRELNRWFGGSKKAYRGALYGRVLDELIASRERSSVAGSIRGDGVGGAPASRRVLPQDALLDQIFDISEGRALRALGELCPFRWVASRIAK